MGLNSLITYLPVLLLKLQSRALTLRVYIEMVGVSRHYNEHYVEKLFTPYC